MPTDAAQVRTYAIRRCNPFLGVLQVVEVGADRAVSSNGHSWEIELRAERRTGWGSLNRNSSAAAWYRYGSWSAQDGLSRGPLAPQFDSRVFRQRCDTLIGVVGDQLPQLPFRLVDTCELWLFDDDERRPVALLASAQPGMAPPSPEPKYWSAALGPDGVPGQRRFPATDTLETLVRRVAGPKGYRHWVVRQNDASGLVGQNRDHLPAEAFPAFLLTEDWPTAHQARLAGDYVAWIAPALLTLQNLSRRERLFLEDALSIQAESVDHHWRLYPEILDKDRVQAARVQCRLQRAQQIGGKTR